MNQSEGKGHLCSGQASTFRVACLYLATSLDWLIGIPLFVLRRYCCLAGW